MKFLLDTNVLSELRKSTPDPHVLHWSRSIENSHLYISALTLGEINRGIEKLPNGRKKNDLISWFDKLEKSFQYRIYPVDSEIAVKWGGLTAQSAEKGIALPSIDGLIAATAYINGAILVTRNTKDFESLPIQVLNPWL